MKTRKKNDPRTESAIWWAVFGVVMFTMHIMIYYSTMKAFPELKVLAIGSSIIIIAASAYGHWLADEPGEGFFKMVGGFFIVVIVVSDIASLYGHTMLARRVSANNAAQVEYEKRRNFEDDMKGREAGRQKDLAAAETELAKARASQAQAEARRLSALPLSARRVFGSITSGGAPPAQPVTGTTAAAGAAAMAPPETEGKAKEDWFDYFAFWYLVGIAAAVLSPFVLSALRMRDKDNNDIPDYIDRLFNRDPRLCQELHPEEYAQIVGTRAQNAAMGNA